MRVFKQMHAEGISSRTTSSPHLGYICFSIRVSVERIEDGEIRVLDYCLLILVNESHLSFAAVLSARTSSQASLQL